MRIAFDRRSSALTGWVARSAPACAAALALLACGSGEPAADGASAAKTGKPVAHRALPGSAISPNMVGAVTSARTGSSNVQLKFELRERPAAAQPLDIDLVILPGPVDRVYGRVEASDGLDLAEGDQIAPTDRPMEGMPLRHSVKVTPKKDGIYTLNAVISVESGGQTSTQTFSIPVIVAAAAPEAPPASAAPTTKPKAH